MILANNEVLIKEWEYGTLKTKKLETVNTLTITNKRIVTESRNKLNITRNEIPVESVKAVSAFHGMPSKFLAYVMIVLGIPLCLVIVGIFLIIAGLNRLKAGVFELELTTSGCEGESLSVGYVSPLKTLFSRKKGKKAPKVKIRINNDVCREIVETIGAVIAENR
ncbi:MAG: hypothetical protein IJE45_05405 [Bacilli bacterium]|nr:hypothetical protein [Bacilli bacterium]